MAGNEVGMQVSFEDVANRNVIRLGSIKINLYVPLRVDQNGLALGRKHVGCVGQTAQIELFEVHRCPSLKCRNNSIPQAEELVTCVGIGKWVSFDSGE